MNSFIKITLLILGVNMFYAQNIIAQSKVFNNVYNDYYYKKIYAGDSYYNDEFLYSINEFDLNTITMYGRGQNHNSFWWESSIYEYQYIIDIDEWGDTLITKRLNLNPSSDLEASFAGIKINNHEYVVGALQMMLTYPISKI